MMVKTAMEMWSIHGYLTFEKMGVMRPAIPPTRQMLKIFDPIMLPSRIPVCDFLSSEREAANSGKLVPTAIIEKPIRRSGTPMVSAMF